MDLRVVAAAAFLTVVLAGACSSAAEPVATDADRSEGPPTTTTAVTAPESCRVVDGCTSGQSLVLTSVPAGFVEVPTPEIYERDGSMAVVLQSRDAEVATPGGDGRFVITATLSPIPADAGPLGPSSLPDAHPADLGAAEAWISEASVEAVVDGHPTDVPVTTISASVSGMALTVTGEGLDGEATLEIARNLEMSDGSSS